MKQIKAQGIVIAPIWPGQSCRLDSGDGIENERQGSKASTRQCKRLPSGSFANVGRYLLMKSTTELVKLGIPERDLAMITHHSQNSRTVQQYYIFASSIRINDVARQLTGEIEIRREFPNELKDRTSGMMLKVGLSAWNDNDEIKTLFYQSLKSLITDYRQGEYYQQR
ncbi:MAG: hypothetical protein EZS28_013959 [Streblomastix strix]|uniref:Uncharacterized protein n=1 Tax=Streblomastix strix TaxID=222440 RepID=A0A5J4W7H4_9EUKA|nr:MAG: hypothetical protein EZS28_013959 [Streblomastix strix]